MAGFLNGGDRKFYLSQDKYSISDHWLTHAPKPDVGIGIARTIVQIERQHTGVRPIAPITATKKSVYLFKTLHFKNG